jgi:oxalate---CoA ligase
VLPPYQLGEIAISGQNVTRGYENNPSANATSFSDGWLRTGDRGYMDEDGYLFIQGRLKEIINRGGEKIAPREVDDVLMQHPAIEQAVAFAVPHPTLGEDVAAAIVLCQGQKATAHEIRQFVAERLVDFKIPRQIVFLAEIPKGPTGKIQRIGLADKLRVEIEQSRSAGESDIPLTPLQSELVEIWQEILEIEKISAQDDFLALGGDSIRAVRILARINEKFCESLTLADLFDKPTIADISALIH